MRALDIPEELSFYGSEFPDIPDFDFPETDTFEENPETVRMMFQETDFPSTDETDSPAPIVTMGENAPKGRKAHRERKKQGNKQK